MDWPRRKLNRTGKGLLPRSPLSTASMPALLRSLERWRDSAEAGGGLEASNNSLAPHLMPCASTSGSGKPKLLARSLPSPRLWARAASTKNDYRRFGIALKSPNSCANGSHFRRQPRPAGGAGG